MYFNCKQIVPMRGSDKLKTIVSINKETFSILLKSLLAFNAIALFFYWQKKKSFILFFFLSPIEILGTFLIFKLCKPVIKKENVIEKLESVVSVNSPGPVSFCWDLIFFGMAGKFLLAFSYKWAIIYTGIPITLLYEFVYKPYQKIKKGK
jgi:hypothetical protein